jgi:hypothetical protein
MSPPGKRQFFFTLSGIVNQSIAINERTLKCNLALKNI